MGKYKVDREELLKILKLVSQAKGEKEIVEQMSHFIFTGDDVICFNDQLCLQHAYDKIEEPFSVKATAFQSIISKIKSKEIEISVTENGVKVNGKTSKAMISTQVEDEVSGLLNNLNEEVDEDSGWLKLPKEFESALHTASLSVSKNASSILSCVYIHNGNAYSTDENCCTRAFIPDSKLPSFFIKPKTIKILKYVGGASEMKITPNWIHFWVADDLVLSARAITGEFITDDLLQDVFECQDSIKLKLPEDILDGIDFVETMTDEFSPTMRIHINKGRLTIKTESMMGWAEKDFKIGGKHKETLFFINILFLQKILKHTHELKICNLGEGRYRILANTDNFDHAISAAVQVEL